MDRPPNLEEPVKLRVERDALADAVAWAGRTVPARPTVPVLRGLRLRVDERAVTVSAFDYVVSAEAVVEAEVAEPGDVLVSGKLLADICRTLPAKPVDLEVDGTRLRLSCGSVRFSLPLLPVEEYPALPEAPTPSGTVPGDVFTAAVTAVGVAAGREEALPNLTGVKVEVAGPRLSLMATDRYRLGLREITWEPADRQLTTSALIPARTLADVARSVGSSSVTLALPEEGGTLVGFETGGRRTTTRVIDYPFPNVRALLPSTSEVTAVVDVAALTDAVRRVALAADRGTAVRCLFSGDEVRLEATGDEAEATEVVGLEAHEGPEIEVAFNPGYLTEGLGALGSEHARLAFNPGRKPTLMTPVGDGPDHQYLLMPVVLSR